MSIPVTGGTVGTGSVVGGVGVGSTGGHSGPGFGNGTSDTERWKTKYAFRLAIIVLSLG